jgi:predicted dehydrogenase
MGREFASAAARWSHLSAEVPKPVITGICSPHESSHQWFRSAVPTITVDTIDYRELLASDSIDAVYIAVPHNLHEEIYTASIAAGKDVMGEKPFGIDREANRRINEAIAEHPEVFVRCASQFAFYPPVVRMIREIRDGSAGRLIEVRAGFHHSSDLDLSKPINWKRRTETNGAYGCMGDLGFHVMYVPFRLGWFPHSVSAVLSNIATERPGPDGAPTACETWDNATLLCEAECDGSRFPLIFETKRMMPGATNAWFLEVYGMKRSYRYSTADPRSLFFCDNVGRRQAWSRLDMGYEVEFSAITGDIFEFGFSDAIQQMWASFMLEREGDLGDRFATARPEELRRSHDIMTAALASHADRRVVDPDAL